MAEPLTINVQQAAKAAPAVYTVPGAVEVEPLSAFATFDGSGAASAFLPTMTFRSSAGLILARVFPGSSVAAGGTADVTFAPFLDQGAPTATNLPYAYLWNTSGAPVVIAPGANAVITWQHFVNVGGSVVFTTTANQTLEIPAIASPAQGFLTVEAMLDGTAAPGPAVLGDLRAELEFISAGFGTTPPSVTTKVTAAGNVLGTWSRLFDTTNIATSYQLRIRNLSGVNTYTMNFGAMSITLMSSA